MLRNKLSGFTLIELMVVIVIIGVLASLAIPRFTEASVKAKVAEAPRVLASFESAYLAAAAEKSGDIVESDLIFQVPTSKWFTYETDAGEMVTDSTSKEFGEKKGDNTAISYCQAKVKVKMNASVDSSDYLKTEDPDKAGNFKHTASKAAISRMVPNFGATVNP